MDKVVALSILFMNFPNSLDINLRGFVKLGGMHVQFNVISREMLHRAREKPEDFRDLVVRVAGYSAYFVELDESLQNDIIARTEHRI